MGIIICVFEISTLEKIVKIYTLSNLDAAAFWVVKVILSNFPNPISSAKSFIVSF